MAKKQKEQLDLLQEAVIARSALTKAAGNAEMKEAAADLEAAINEAAESVKAARVVLQPDKAPPKGFKKA